MSLAPRERMVRSPKRRQERKGESTVSGHGRAPLPRKPQHRQAQELAPGGHDGPAPRPGWCRVLWPMCTSWLLRPRETLHPHTQVRPPCLLRASLAPSVPAKTNSTGAPDLLCGTEEQNPEKDQPLSFHSSFSDLPTVSSPLPAWSAITIATTIIIISIITPVTIITIVIIVIWPSEAGD